MPKVKVFFLLFLLLMFSPRIFAQRMTLGSKFSIYKTIPMSDEIRSRCNLVLGYNFHFSIFYDVNNSYMISSGLGISKLAMELIDSSPSFLCDLSNGLLAEPERSFFAFRHSAYYLSIPLRNRIKVIGEENHLYLDFGIISSFFFTKKSDSYLHECGRNRISVTNNNKFSPKKFLINLDIGVGYEFRVNSKLKAYIEPLCQFYFKQFYDNPPSRILSSELFGNPYILNLGISFGTRFLKST